MLKSKEENQREVIHYLWTGWPDFGVPGEDAFTTMNWLSHKINELAIQGKRPVIHCSAGVGRTGTLLSICKVQHLLEHYKEANEGKISIFSIARRLREQRPGMINTAEQYRLVYRYAMWLIENLK